MSQTDITVYVSKGCTYCEQVITYLEERGASHTIKNVSLDDAAFKEWKTINPMGTPLTVKGEQQVLGFNKDKLDALL
ncbi:glutaredoxin family protein [Salisediminibacterium beveridgei]|uniref:Glutaredoxin n=1 Tax=Salisediminibacterium beveridgei TaxID=632773 RepID=A0A1D7QWE4_9BACI|nr:glutaredoxin family protein [Salisediminibacterium beveridgei]AOM83335.1 Glutaredoxin [Salisediminibacterium beveridgei]